MIVRLKNRRVLRLSGEDVYSFIQGLISNDVYKAGSPFYALLLSAKGRIVSDLFLHQQEDGGLLVECDSLVFDRLFKLLHLYKLRARVEIKEQESLCVCVGWNEKKYPQGFQVDPRFAGLGYRGVISIEDAPYNEDDLAWAYHRYDFGIAEGAEMEGDKAIPLQWNIDLLKGISWTKGCYVGQELTARSKFVGEVRKRVFPFSVLNGAVVAEGEDLFLNSQCLGSVLKIVDDHGLAMFRFLEYDFEKGKPLVLESASGALCELHIPEWLSAYIREEKSK